MTPRPYHLDELCNSNLYPQGYHGNKQRDRVFSSPGLKSNSCHRPITDLLWALVQLDNLSEQGIISAKTVRGCVRHHLSYKALCATARLVTNLYIGQECDPVFGHRYLF